MPKAPYHTDVTIQNVPAPQPQPVALLLSVNNRNIQESAGTNVSVKISKANGQPFSADQTVTLNLRGTAAPGTDYTVTPADADTSAPGHQVTISEEKDTVTLTLSPINDSTADPCEAVLASAKLKKGGVEVLPKILMTIADDDNSTSTTSLSLGLNNLRIGDLTTADNGKDWYSFAAKANTSYIIEVKQPLVFMGLDKPAAGGDIGDHPQLPARPQHPPDS